MESNGHTYYLLTLDPEKYIKSDETLSLVAENGMPVKEAFLTIGFDQDGKKSSIDLKTSYDAVDSLKTLLFSDYDSTVIDPMPKANKTFEDMNAEMEAKTEALSQEILKNENAESNSSSSSAAQ